MLSHKCDSGGYMYFFFFSLSHLNILVKREKERKKKQQRLDWIFVFSGNWMSSGEIQIRFFFLGKYLKCFNLQFIFMY